MGKIYEFLGLTVGTAVSGQDQKSKREAYACDVVYGTNNEYGFDYLRDNMAFSAEDKVQRQLHFGIVDEVDSILIDEARTPLIISGPAEDSTELYVKINKLIPDLVRQQEEDGPGDFSVDEKARQVYLTEDGHDRAEKLLAAASLLPEGAGLYDVGNIMLLHHLYAGLRGRRHTPLAHPVTWWCVVLAASQEMHRQLLCLAHHNLGNVGRNRCVRSILRTEVHRRFDEREVLLLLRANVVHDPARMPLRLLAVH